MQRMTRLRGRFTSASSPSVPRDATHHTASRYIKIDVLLCVGLPPRRKNMKMRLHYALCMLMTPIDKNDDIAMQHPSHLVDALMWATFCGESYDTRKNDFFGGIFVLFVSSWSLYDKLGARIWWKTS